MPAPPVALMLDQCHNVEEKIPGQIRSVLNVAEMTARALLVDTDALAAAQEAGDVLGANGIFMDAFYTDVRPALRSGATERGLPADPMAAYAASGYREHHRRRARRRHPIFLGRLSFSRHLSQLNTLS